MTDADGSVPIIYPIGSRHLLIAGRPTSRATDVLVRCVLTVVLWCARAVLRFDRRRMQARTTSRALRGGFRPIRVD